MDSSSEKFEIFIERSGEKKQKTTQVALVGETFFRLLKIVFFDLKNT